MNYLVDIPMCAYNHEAYIATAIDGVVSQKANFKFRLIIGEDFSSDNTRAIVMRYAAEYPDIIFPIFNGRNLGAFENSRNLFSSCTAKYIALCDGDDYWTDPFKLQKQVDFLEANSDFSLTFHNTRDLSPFGEKLKYDYSLKKEFEFSDFVNFFYARTVSMVYRRQPVPLHELFPKIPLADWALGLIILQSGKAYYFNEVMGAYRIHATGAWGGASANKKTVDAFKTFYLLKRILSNDYKRVIENKLFDLSFSYVRVSLFQKDFFGLCVGIFYFLKSPTRLKIAKVKSLLKR